MEQQPHVPHDVVVECDEIIDRAPGVVWDAVVASETSELAEQHAPQQQQQPGQGGLHVIRPSSETFMEQRVVDRQDAVMVLRMAMTRSVNLPWSAYESTIRVEPVAKDPSKSRVVVSCLATPTDDERTVTGLLRGLILLWLRSLKARVERT